MTASPRQKAGKSQRPRPSSDAPAGKRRRLSVTERRAALVEAARLLFEQRTFDEVSTEDIARVAGVSQSLIFHYFPSKSDLYEAVLASNVDALIAQVSEAVERHDNPIERTLAGVEAYFDYVRAKGERFSGVMRGEGARASEAAAAMVLAGRSRLLELIEAQIRAAVPNAELGEPRLFRAGLTSWLGFVQELSIDWIEHGDLSRDELMAMSVRAMVASMPGLLPSMIRNVTPELAKRYGHLLADLPAQPYPVA